VVAAVVVVEVVVAVVPALRLKLKVNRRGGCRSVLG
jgi:hypothetical protein